MASMVIFAKPDNIHPDPKLDWTKFKRGDVIDIRDDDNFYWGEAVQGPQALNWWRVVTVPNTPAAALLSLAAGDSPSADGSAYRLRINSINLDMLEFGKNLGITDRLTSDVPTLLAVRTVKPVIANPNVIGSDPRVIG